MVGTRCGRIWIVDIDSLRQDIKKHNLRGNQQSTNTSATFSSQYRHPTQFRDDGIAVVFLLTHKAERVQAGLRFVRSLGKLRGLLLASLLAPPMNVPCTGGESDCADGASPVQGLNGDLSCAMIVITPTIAGTVSTSFTTERASMCSELSSALFGSHTTLTGCPIVLHADLGGALHWWPLPVRPSILEIPFPTARRLDHYRDNPVAGPIVAILPLAPSRDKFDAQISLQCYGLLIIASSGDCRLITLDSNVPWDGRRRSVDGRRRSVGVSRVQASSLTSNILCIETSLSGPIGAAIALPGKVFHLNTETGQIFCTAVFDGTRKGGPGAISIPQIVFDVKLSIDVPFAPRILALTSCNVPASSEKDSISHFPTVLAVLTEEGCVMGIRTDTLDDTVTEYEPEETSITEEKVAGTIASDDDKKDTSAQDKKTSFEKKGWRNASVVKSRLEERLALLRANNADVAAAESRRREALLSLERMGASFEFAARISKAKKSSRKRNLGQVSNLESLTPGWSSRSYLDIPGFSHEAYVVDMDDSTRRGLDVYGQNNMISYGDGSNAQNIYVHASICVDRSTADILESYRSWMYTIDIVVDTPPSCESLPRRNGLAPQRLSHAIPIGPFKPRAPKKVDDQDCRERYPDFVWDVRLPIQATVSGHPHAPLRLNFGLTSTSRLKREQDRLDDFCVSLGDIHLDPIASKQRYPHLRIDVSLSGFRRAAQTLREMSPVTTFFDDDESLPPFRPCRVTQQVIIRESGTNAVSSPWNKFRTLLTALDINPNAVQWGNNGHSVVFQVGAYDLVSISMIGSGYFEGSVLMELQATDIAILATILDRFSFASALAPDRIDLCYTLHSSSTGRQLEALGRLEPIKKKLRELDLKVSSLMSNQFFFTTRMLIYWI